MIDTEKTYSGLTDGCAAAGKERCRLVELVGDGTTGDKIKQLINDGIDVRLLPRYPGRLHWLRFTQVALKLYRAGVSPLPFEPGLLKGESCLDGLHIPS